jgi:hypothetical protein
VTNKPARQLAFRPSRSAIAVGLLAVFFCASISYPAQEAGLYPGRLGIAKAKHLSAEEREVEARFATYLEGRTNNAVDRYIAKYGKEIGTDAARELSPDYAPGGMDALDPVTNAARTKWGDAVFRPARAMARELYRLALRRDTPSHQRRQVVFTAGGAGVGKSTSIRQLPEIAHAVEAAEIVYDTTLSDSQSAAERINQALDAGRVVSIVFVYRDPIDSLVKGMFPRAKMTGRITTLEGFLNTHIRAVEAVLKIAAVYKNDPRVVIAVVDNSRRIEDITVSDLRFVENKAGKYSREALKAQLIRATDAAYEASRKSEEGDISEVLYRAFYRRTR